MAAVQREHGSGEFRGALGIENASSAPISQCGTAGRRCSSRVEADGLDPTLSSSPAPSGTSGAGTFGIRNNVREKTERSSCSDARSRSRSPTTGSRPGMPRLPAVAWLSCDAAGRQERRQLVDARSYFVALGDDFRGARRARARAAGRARSRHRLCGPAPRSRPGKAARPHAPLCRDARHCRRGKLSDSWVLAALARRGDARSSPTCGARSGSTSASGKSSPALDEEYERADSTSLSPRSVGDLRASQDPAQATAEAEAFQGRETVGRRARARPCIGARRPLVLLRETLCADPDVPRPDVPDGAGEDDNLVIKTVASTRRATAATRRCRTGEIGRSSAFSIPSAPRNSPDPCSRVYRGHGARLLPRAHELAPIGTPRGTVRTRRSARRGLVRYGTMTRPVSFRKFADDALQGRTR